MFSLRRPPNPEGAPLEPLVPGAPINPRDYSGRRRASHKLKRGPRKVPTTSTDLGSMPRRNWLSRCKKVAETSGTWLLESFGSGSLEVQVSGSCVPPLPPFGTVHRRESWLNARSKDPEAEVMCLDLVAGERPEWKPSEDTDGTAEETRAEDTEAAVAVKALGTEGEREARAEEIDMATSRPGGVEGAAFAPTRRSDPEPLRVASESMEKAADILKQRTAEAAECWLLRWPQFLCDSDDIVC
eukprot:Skav236027  [mRNA]  locus=scaffold1509:23604:29091:+ [translate_table: standard]